MVEPTLVSSWCNCRFAQQCAVFTVACLVSVFDQRDPDRDNPLLSPKKDKKMWRSGWFLAGFLLS